MNAIPDSVSTDVRTYLASLDSDIISIQAVSGGSISSAFLIELTNHRRLFLKYSLDKQLSGAFSAEHSALSLFLQAGTIRVPRPLFSTDNLLLCEAFETGSRNEHWHETLGRQLAQLHLSTRQPLFGLAENNFIGTSPQLNGWHGSWLEFWREQRLGFQLEMFRKKTVSDDPLISSGNRLLGRLDKLLTLNEPAVLLHGDLWSGNAAAHRNGDPVIFDPAAYYGQREAEFGMMRLFGGFGLRTEAAYQEVWPFEPGYEERISIYRLYHELNHLNIFGYSYYEQCLKTLRQLCRLI